MATFPILASGALTQYPSPVLRSQQVAIIRFVDGSDQRFLMQGKAWRSWQIRLDLLTEGEISAIEAFFQQQQGTYSSFDFLDPLSGAVVPNCRIAESSLVTLYADVNDASASLWVIETNA